MKTISIQAQRDGYRRYGHVWTRKAQLADVCSPDEQAAPGHVRLTEADFADLTWYAKTPNAMIILAEPNELDADLTAKQAELERLRSDAGKMLEQLGALRSSRAEMEAEIEAIQARRGEIERILAEAEDKAARAEQAALRAEERLAKASADTQAIEEARRSRKK